ncbi:PQ loop repeat-domain-containing protein [Phycomyces blakesleeanus]|uniref:PQ loop repeat-domain-containing protein n=1 Tax=Phycomyces blakesleeanus TaxID=4837 RepID=A0ABR3AXG5_PHYBL
MDSYCIPTIEGEPFIPWIYTIFGDCVYGWQEATSILLGYLSIFCWLNAQMPQVIKNYRLGNADSLSFLFLTVWLTGDVANYIGCVITNQLPFQRYLAIYFTAVDGLLCAQWLYYVCYLGRLSLVTSDSNEEDDGLERISTETAIKPGYAEREPLLIAAPSKQNYTKTANSATTALLMIAFVSFSNPTSVLVSSDIIYSRVGDDTTIWIGRVFAWICAFLYLSSRVPQIVRNYHRRSVEGLSMALFFFAAMGNLTYCLSIFANPHATRHTMLEAVPYLLGSAGTLVFDGTIFLQYMLYTPID